MHRPVDNNIVSERPPPNSCISTASSGHRPPRRASVDENYGRDAKLCVSTIFNIFNRRPIDFYAIWCIAQFLVFQASPVDKL